MSLIQWEEKYSVKHATIDSQHKKLVELINNLHEAMKVGKAKDKLGVHRRVDRAPGASRASRSWSHRTSPMGKTGTS
jgi:hypothetical protein